MTTIDWTPVEEASAEKTASGYQVAVLESAKILEQRLRQEHLGGPSLLEQVTAARLFFTRPDDVTEAAQYVEDLRFGSSRPLTAARSAKLQQTIRQAVADINELSRQRDSWQAKAKLYLGQIRARRSWFGSALAVAAGVLLVIWLLANTTPGSVLVTVVVTVVNTVFAWVFGLLIVAAIILGAVLGTAVYLDRSRGGGRIKTEADE